jgi:hypothetical protein
VILHPSILALAISSLLICLMVLYSTFYGIRILRHWDIASGSERQLELERRTYLISTIVSYFLALQLISLFLFIFTADSICNLFVGAMCAVGTLSVNGFGYPTLLLKIITFILAGLWLILNHADNQGYDYPLIRKKYLMLAVLAPLILLETIVQGIYFVGLKPDIITSCCGSLFSPAARGIATEIASLPALPMLTLFYVSALVTFAAGLWFYCLESGGYLFAILSGSHLLVAIVAIISVFSLYIYQMPSHHCPFCILQKEYYFIGYPIYIAILVGGVTGLGAGMLMPFRSVASLREILPRILKNLTLASLASLLFLTLLVSWPVLGTSFTLR